MGFSPTTKGRAWVLVIHIKNMESMELKERDYRNPEYLADFLLHRWNESGKGRSSAVTICESKDGCYHAHMAVYGNTTTLKNVSDIFAQCHVEPQLGGKKELAAYLLKQGKYAEKDEKILYAKDIDAIQDKQGRRDDLEVIEEMLVKGMKPYEILSSNFRFYKYEKMILRAYVDQLIAEMPTQREIYCEYHVGESRSGKTYYYNQLCEKHGVDNIYLLTDYDNNASGGLDDYIRNAAPPILFMDEFKGHGISYGKLLVMLNEYPRMQTHSRYTNTYNLWSTVIITSVYPPERIYEIMVPSEYRDVDSYNQLIGRINKVVFHYKDDDRYKTYTMDASNYINYDDLRNRALGQNQENGFRNLSAQEQANMPFKEVMYYE